MGSGVVLGNGKNLLVGTCMALSVQYHAVYNQLLCQIIMDETCTPTRFINAINQ